MSIGPDFMTLIPSLLVAKLFVLFGNYLSALPLLHIEERMCFLVNGTAVTVNSLG